MRFFVGGWGLENAIFMGGSKCHFFVWGVTKLSFFMRGIKNAIFQRGVENAMFLQGGQTFLYRGKKMYGGKIQAIIGGQILAFFVQVKYGHSFIKFWHFLYRGVKFCYFFMEWGSNFGNFLQRVKFCPFLYRGLNGKNMLYGGMLENWQKSTLPIFKWNYPKLVNFKRGGIIIYLVGCRNKGRF